MQHAGTNDATFWVWWRQLLDSVAVILVSAVVGAGLVALAWRFGTVGPVVLMGIAMIPVVALTVLRDPRIAPVLIFLTWPFSSNLGSLGPLPLELVEAALLVALGATVLTRLSRGISPLGWGAPLWWLIALIAWTTIALSSGADIVLGVKQVASLVGGLLMATLILAVSKDSKDLRAVMGAFLAISMLISITALMGAGELRSQFAGSVVSGRLQGAFAQPNELGSFCALALFVGLSLALGSRTASGRRVAWIGVVVVLPALVLSLSRGAWIGTMLGALYLLAVLPQARRILLFSIPPFIIAALLLGTFAPTSPQVQVVGDRVAAFGAKNPYDTRPQIYAEAKRQISADPLTGSGPGSFPVTSSRSTAANSTVSADHAHNIWLTWGAESGLPAAVLLTAFILGALMVARRAGKAASRSGDRQDEAMSACLAAAIVTVIGQGFFDYTWRNQVLFFSIATVLGAAMVMGRSRGDAVLVRSAES